MNAKHTPGPWFEWEDAVYSGSPSIKRRGHLEGYDKQICEMDDLDTTGRERKANARLIAAAPELLDVMQCILAEDMICYMPEEYVARVRAAIAKATGSAA